MHSNFNSSLVNDSYGDPCVIVQFSQTKKALLFDIGDISALSVRKILSITHVFVTHTHIDHFYGFDRILRLSLGRNKILRLYGPPGFFHNIEGKLASYQWNLISAYKQDLIICATEVYIGYTITQNYRCKNKFKPSKQNRLSIKDNIILSEKEFLVKAITLDHGIPILAFSLQEKPKIKILPNKLVSMGLVPGQWISSLKNSLTNNSNKKTTMFSILNNKSETITLTLKNLEKEITCKILGEKITYITDVSYTNENNKAILKFAYKSTHLFIEAMFKTEHEAMAFSKHHLTAKQAGKIARISKSEKYTLFHHSPRYSKCSYLLEAEAKSEYMNLDM